MTVEASRVKKGSVMDISEGVRVNRRCTDLLFFLLFLGHIGVYIWTAKSGIEDGGNALRLIAPRDFQGSFCGVPDSTNDAQTPVSGYSKVMYTLNMTNIDSAFSTNFATALSSSVIEAAITATDGFEFWTTNGMATTFASDMDYLQPVCVSSCDYESYTPRVYEWEGPNDATQRANWVTYQTAATSYSTYFGFNALPVEVCPYDARYCVYLTSMSTYLDKYCVPLAGSVVSSSWSSSLSSNFGEMIGDVINSWKMLLVSVAIALAVGFFLMMFLRYCGGCFIWVIILACFTTLAAAGATGLLYADRCVNEGYTDAATRIKENGWTITDSCTDGYAVASESQRQAVRVFGIVLMSLSLVYLFFVVLFCKRIRLGVAIQKVAAQFITQNKATLFIPFFQTVMFACWFAGWLAIAACTLAQIPDDQMKPRGTNTDYATAASDCGGTEYVYMSGITDPLLIAPTYTYSCKQARYHFDWRICYQFFCLLWVAEFLVAWGQLIIAGTAGVWYFSPNSVKGNLGLKPLMTGFYNATRYHLGTAMFGSVTLAVVSFVHWWLVLLTAKLKTTQSKVLKTIFSPLLYLVSCVERFLAFLNKNAYIQTALVGTNFCVSAKNSFLIIVRNALRITALSGVSNLVSLFCRIFITSVTTGLGWVMINTWFDGKLRSPILVIIAFIIIGMFVSNLIMNIFMVAVNSVMQCFLIDEEVHADEGGAKFTPDQLKSFLQNDNRN